MKYPITICLAGASGLVGHELLLILAHLDEIKSIKAVSRSPMGKIPPKTENLIVDFEQIEKHAGTLSADVFICCLGTTIKQAGSQQAFRKVDYDFVLNFARTAEKAKASKLIVISAMGANSESKIFYNKVKGEMEEALYDLDIPQIEIFRPSLLLGQRKEKRFGEQLGQTLSPFLNIILQGPLKKYRAIKAHDVARAMAIATINLHDGRFIYESDEIMGILGN